MIAIGLMLFLIMDPFGNMIVVNSLVSDLPRWQQALVILREGAIAMGILILIAIFGSAMLDTLGLEEASLQLSGGIVLFLIALGMLFPSRRVLDEETTDTPLVVPIAMPLIAGPSAISMVILFSKHHAMPTVIGGIALATISSTLLLAACSLVYHLLGRRGSIALERLMGLLLIMIAVQMLLDGVDAFINARLQAAEAVNISWRPFAAYGPST
ncbi:MarC family protein [Aeoliella mucimassa]|uniref:UPF0056 membrane protein n=1 Tax=Aeoliella mucimassa TaxID=2527972 RepID=A0A518ATU4_9BACT|nr:MarC family protein [Aeoliella mucimassa]QDU58149.1 putative antibiotic transporter [Aeoliella mucimassa]